MFGDSLSYSQQTKLLATLADTALPFQCAHGRVSMVPLCEVQPLVNNAAGSDSGAGAGTGAETVGGRSGSGELGLGLGLLAEENWTRRPFFRARIRR